MPKRQPLQTTFEGGVASPLIYGRSDLPGYAKSAKDMENMYADSRGPAVSRNGMEYLYNVGDSADRFGRLFTFRVSYTLTFVVIITPTFVQITDKNGLAEGSNALVNGDFQQDSTGWTTVTGVNGSVTFPANTALMNSGQTLDLATSFAYLEQEIVALSNPANLHSIKIDSRKVSTNPDDDLVLTIGTAQGLDDIVSTNITTLGNFEVSFTPGVANIWVRLRVNGTPELIDTGFAIITVYRDNVREIDSITILDLVSVPSGEFIEFASPWTEDQIHDIQVEMAPDLQRMYFVHREVATQQLDADVTVSPITWMFGESIFDWTPGINPWVVGNFPGAITFFQSRLYLAATFLEPVSIWGSKPGSANYNNFSDAGGTDPDDPIKVILARNADIQWMQGSKVLYVGCDNSEHIITSDGAAVINSDIEVQQQSSYGSARIKTDWVSTAIAFTSWDQRRLRAVNFVTNTKNIQSLDLTFPSEHLTLGLITEMHHASHPVNRLWTPLADGSMLSMTFEKDRKVSAWSPHSTLGLIQSLTILEEQGQSVVYALVLRESTLRVLRLGRKEIFMDEYVERGYADPTDTVDRLDHLEGDTIQVVGDGNLYPNAVVSGGEITIDGPDASNFVVGLILPRLVETMLVDDIRGGQSTAASKKGWNRIYVRVFASILPLINGVRPPDRTPSSLMDAREPNRSQDVIVHNVGWDFEGTIKVEQNLPFNLVVTGIYGELSEESL